MQPGLYAAPGVFPGGAHDPCMDYADKLIMFPDLFGYFYTGVKGTAEATIAGTTGLFDYRQERWSTELCEALGIPTRLFMPPKRPDGCWDRCIRPLRIKLAP